MCKWNYILFLVVLVPPSQAQEKNPSTGYPDLSSKLFHEIDEYLKELILNHEAMQRHSLLCNDNWGSLEWENEEDHSLLAPMVRDKFHLLEKHVHSRNLVNECPNMANNIEEYERSLKANPKPNMTNNLTEN